MVLTSSEQSMAICSLDLIDTQIIDSLHHSSTRYRFSGDYLHLITSRGNEASNVVTGKSRGKNKGKENEFTKFQDVVEQTNDSIERVAQEHAGEELSSFNLRDIYPSYIAVMLRVIKLLSPVFLVPVIAAYSVAVIVDSQKVAAKGLALFAIYLAIITVLGVVTVPFLLFVHFANRR